MPNKHKKYRIIKELPWSPYNMLKVGTVSLEEEPLGYIFEWCDGCQEKKRFIIGHEIVEETPEYFEEVVDCFVSEKYELSADYDVLWDLICAGHRIAAWLLYSDEYAIPVWDLVEVKMDPKKKYQIGSRGMMYAGEQTKAGFIETCEMYKLKFIK